MTLQQHLLSLGACGAAKEWVGKSPPPPRGKPANGRIGCFGGQHELQRIRSRLLC